MGQGEPGATKPDTEATARGDTSISTAFALGWETASLFRGASFDAGRREGASDALPGLSALTDRQRTELAVDLIDAGLRKLGDRLTATTPVDEARIEHLRRLSVENPDDRRALREGVRELHLDVLFTLTAADLRLGRAYGLGHALADTCLQPVDRASFERAFGTRLVSIKDWLADLASSFPAHSSRAVVLSLRAWEAWTADPRLDDRPLDWEKHGAGVRDALHRQGELWRDLLACDKHGEDMLETGHYLRAANALVARMASTLWHFLRPLRYPLLATIPLFGAGIALLVFSDSAGTEMLGAILTVAGVLGITGAGIRTRLGKVATQLQSRLWGAELDFAIAEAVLIGPPGWGTDVTKLAIPPTGAEPTVAPNLETLREFRLAVAAREEKKIRELLAPNAEFVVAGEATHSKGPVTEWLLRAPEARRVAAEPHRVVALGPGVLVADVDLGTDVWRIQEGKVRLWQSFAGEDEAHAAAEAAATGVPGPTDARDRSTS